MKLQFQNHAKKSKINQKIAHSNKTISLQRTQVEQNYSV
jgi:hypothetical protein